MIEYKTLTYSVENIQSLPLLWKENWNLCSIYDWKIFLSREVKKEVKSRALTTEWNKSISYLRKQREQIDSWEPIHIPEFISNEPEWSKFISYWTQKNSEDWKMHCEKQRTFELRWRWQTWHKEKKENKSNTIG